MDAPGESAARTTSRRGDLFATDVAQQPDELRGHVDRTDAVQRRDRGAGGRGVGDTHPQRR